jgi:hypothetical protein
VGVHGEEGENPDPPAHDRDRHARDAPVVLGQPRPLWVVPKEVPVAGLAALHLLRCPAASTSLSSIDSKSAVLAVS